MINQSMYNTHVNQLSVQKLYYIIHKWVFTKYAWIEFTTVSKFPLLQIISSEIDKLIF